MLLDTPESSDLDPKGLDLVLGTDPSYSNGDRYLSMVTQMYLNSSCNMPSQQNKKKLNKIIL